MHHGLQCHLSNPQVKTQDINSINDSSNHVIEYIFGFPILHDFHILLFIIFFFIYLLSVSGNGLIFIVVTLEQKLHHTPMYFFVRNLSLVDMMTTIATIPKMLNKFSTHPDSFSFQGCFVQMYFFVSFNAIECYLLSVMAFDRYVAIYSPLRYHSIMNRQLYISLALVSWTLGFASPIVVIILALKLPSCGADDIQHYYCDHPLLIQLACADTPLHVKIGTSLSALLLITCFTMIVMSYSRIIISILRIPSSEGRSKTFSTCASHFIVVNMFFLPPIFMYIFPKPFYSSDIDLLVDMLYTVLTPMLNPIVYSFKNRDIKDSLKKHILHIKKDHQ
ncbi:unnamed protein product [Ranitomeya imitator]|uniref:Olfactory receptor n=1 Tax=Ranitomeya imitator TaxID=111125 RepID=A0ABN9MQH4_9NEOB|nr:unnamed protein product [Ranitomeya imitator]